MDWVHEQLNARNQIKCGMDQVFKDLGRDKVMVNSIVYCGADGPECVIGALTQVLIQVSQSDPNCTALNEAQALSIVRSILLSWYVKNGILHDTIVILIQSKCINTK